MLEIATNPEVSFHKISTIKGNKLMCVTPRQFSSNKWQSITGGFNQTSMQNRSLRIKTSSTILFQMMRNKTSNRKY